MDALRDAARAPQRCANNAEILTRIADLDTAQCLYLKEHPGEVISQYERAKIPKEMRPEEMQQDLVRLDKRTYDEIYHYVASQAPLRREEEMK